MDRDLLAGDLFTLIGGPGGPGVTLAISTKHGCLSPTKSCAGVARHSKTTLPFGDLSTINAATPAAAAETAAFAQVSPILPLGTEQKPERIGGRTGFLPHTARPDAAIAGKSVPPWASGWAVERTFGPFVDVAGRRYWLTPPDLRQVEVIGGPSGVVPRRLSPKRARCRHQRVILSRRGLFG